ncbi:DinB family protein [Paenibacillus hodogayensis]|uniref:DinB family protein n=1 Tax=Paenibacillus hodogayensis TaxID=279208 RepID=A0ABV5W184_9BACL
MEAALKELRRFTAFVEEAGRRAADSWYNPILPGKWSIHEIVGHIWLWDTYALEQMIPEMTQGAVLQMANRQSINRNAELFSLRIQKAEMIDHFAATRNELAEACSFVHESGISFFIGARRLQMESYIREYVVEHDRHHEAQIEAFLLRHKP